MKMYPSFRYQLYEHRLSVMVYYAVLTGMILLSLIFMPFVSDEAGGFVSTNGCTAVTMVFVFVLSLCAFKDSFFMNLQHGVSRRTFFLSRLAVMGALCGILSLLDEAYTLLLKGLQAVWPHVFRSDSLYEMTYCMTLEEGGVTVQTSLAAVPLSVVFSFFLLLAASSLGYLVTVFMYRLNKMGKILFWAGTPILFILCFAFLDAHPGLQAKVFAFLVSAAQLCCGSLPRVSLTCALLAAAFSALAWLLMRRAAVK